ncbi:unnamed protein product [Closterium sp. NIES-54]
MKASLTTYTELSDLTSSLADGSPEVQQAAVDALKSIAAVNPKLVLLFCSELLQSGQSTSLWWSVPQLPQHHKTNLFSVISASITSLTRQQHSAAAAAAAAGVSAGAERAAWGAVTGGGAPAEGAGVGMGADGGGGVSDHTMLVQSIKLALAEMQVAGRSGTGSAQVREMQAAGDSGSELPPVPLFHSLLPICSPPAPPLPLPTHSSSIAQYYDF